MNKSKYALMIGSISLLVACKSVDNSGSATVRTEAPTKEIAEPAQTKLMNYPQTKKVDHVNNYHGTNLPDPYRWLENDTTAEVAAWVKAQNEVTFSYLNQIPFRSKIKDRLS